MKGPIDILLELKPYALKLTKNKEDAEDLIQDVAIKIIRADLLPPQENDLKSYISRVITNTFIDTFRKAKRDPLKYANNALGEEALEDRKINPNVYAKFELEDVKEEIRNMPNSFHARILLAFVKGYHIREISRNEGGISLNTITGAIRYSRKYLRQQTKS